jgi:hypothetical protein
MDVMWQKLLISRRELLWGTCALVAHPLHSAQALDLVSYLAEHYASDMERQECVEPLSRLLMTLTEEPNEDVRVRKAQAIGTVLVRLDPYWWKRAVVTWWNTPALAPFVRTKSYPE